MVLEGGSSSTLSRVLLASVVRVCASSIHMMRGRADEMASDITSSWTALIPILVGSGVRCETTGKPRLWIWSARLV